MPLLAVHMSIVQEVVEQLNVPEIREHLGAALLGATAPDRRVLTRQPREETHFFRLTEDGMGAGFRGMKAVFPNLAAPRSEPDWPLTAFMVGYVSHLAADEAWIVNVYRAYFDHADFLGREPARNILDRALQYELEHDVLQNRERLAVWRDAITSAESGLDAVPADFVPPDVLRTWHTFVANEVLSREGGWHEFPRFIARFMDDPGLDEAEVEAFLNNPDVMFQRVYSRVPAGVIKEHRNVAVAESLRYAREMVG